MSRPHPHHHPQPSIRTHRPLAPPSLLIINPNPPPPLTITHPPSQPSTQILTPAPKSQPNPSTQATLSPHPPLPPPQSSYSIITFPIPYLHPSSPFPPKPPAISQRRGRAMPYPPSPCEKWRCHGGGWGVGECESVCGGVDGCGGVRGGEGSGG